MIYLILFLEVLLGAFAFFIFYLAPKFSPMNKGNKFLVQGNLDEALLEFNREIENNPDNYEAHFQLANLYLKKDVALKAEEHFKCVLEIDKFSQEIDKMAILQKLGEIQFNLNKLEEAYFSFKEVISIYKSDYTANNYIGLIYAGQLLYDDAIEFFKNAIRSRPNDINARINAALCMLQLNNLDNAINLFQETLKLAAENQQIKFYLGVSYFQGKVYKKAIDLLLEILKKTDDKQRKYFCYRLIGMSYFLQGKINDCKEIFDTGTEFVKSNSMIEEYKQLLYDYGIINILKNNWVLAEEKLIVLKTIDSYFEYIDDLISYIYFRKRKDEATEEEQEDVSDFSPAITSYYKAAQHMLGMKEDGNEGDKYAKIFSEIKNEWMKSFIPNNFLWKQSGLTSSKPFNLEILTGKDKIESIPKEAKKVISTSFIKDFMKLARGEFQNAGKKIVEKLGYTIIKENFKPTLVDFVDGDGIDYLCKTNNGTGIITLIQLRRWDQGKVGEIPFRNMTQEMSEGKAKKGVFIVPAELTPGAQKFLEKMPNIKAFTYSELSKLLRNVIK